MIRGIWRIGGILFLVSCLWPQSGSKTTRPPATISLYLENDVFAGTDLGYTNGVKLTWVSPQRISFSLGQNIYTPADIESKELIADDRPYAGVTYLGVGFHHIEARHMSTLEFDLGIVGPDSLAGEIQEFIHSLFKFRDPRGWEHQLANELVLGLTFDHKRRLVRGTGPGRGDWDLIGRASASLSNMITAMNIGLELRWGWNLPRDFGTFLIQPGGDSNAVLDSRERPKYGFHVFIAVEGHVLPRNIFLDGNTFAGSHRVDKYPLTGNLLGGAALTLGKLKISYAHVYRTRQFRTQKQPQLYGSVNLSYTF